MRNLEPGSSFGEIALINNVKRTMSVRSVGDSQLLSLQRSTFNRILGSIKKYLKGDYTTGDNLDCSFSSHNSNSSKGHEVEK